MLFFELIQVALGRRERLSMVPSPSEWWHLYQLSIQHALMGVCFQAINRLPHEQCPDESLILDWIWQVQRTREKNERLTARCAEVVERLEDDGFCTCLLKGQGNARLYDDLADYRQSGDIDVWVIPQHCTSFRKARRQTIGYVLRLFPDTLLRYHHIEFPMIDDVEVELHFVPIYLNNPLLNRKLNIWYKAKYEQQMRNKIRMGEAELSVPTREFNLLYQLLHIYKHIFEEGIGLRQLMDYYFVLVNQSPEEGNGSLPRMLKELHLQKLAGAVMYVLGEVMGLPPEYMICPPRKAEGLSLLSEIMQSGNFGHFDSRGENSDTGQDFRSKLHRYWRKTKRNIVLSYDYPQEGLWEPVFHLYHYFWQIFNLWKI